MCTRPGMALALVFAFGCNGTKTAPEPAPEPTPTVEPEPEPEPEPASGELKMCGGIAALKCDDGFTCVDDPRDSCDPANGGADCSGVCKGCNDESLGRTYTGTSREQCAAMKFACEEGQTPFFDDCGCGCVSAPE